MIDLSKSYDSPVAMPQKAEKHYPEIHIEMKNKDFDTKLMDKDIKVQCVVRIKRYSIDGENKCCLDLQVKKIDFGKDKEYSSIFEAVMDSEDSEEEDDE